MSTGRILIVDDDPQIRRVMRTTLAAVGYEVEDARSGEAALEKLGSSTYDLVLLDINMPGMDGLETCRAIRPSSDVAIIMLSVRNAERDKVEALDSGADDYVTKPFSTQELLARIRAAMRRHSSTSDMALQHVTLEGVEIDFQAREVAILGRKEHLTPKQLDLLWYLVSHPNQVIPHREILRAVWGIEYGEEVEYLRAFIKQLRKKIEPDPANPRYLLTEPWVGYRFQMQESS